MFGSFEHVLLRNAENLISGLSIYNSYLSIYPELVLDAIKKCVMSLSKKPKVRRDTQPFKFGVPITKHFRLQHSTPHGVGWLLRLA